MGDNKNFVLFAVLSLAILMGYQYFYAGPKIEEQRRYEQQQAALNPTPNPASDAIAPLDSGPTLETTPTGPAYEDAGSVNIITPELVGSLSLRGARLDDLSLVKHKETMKPDSANFHLLNPFGKANAYFARFGWTAKGKAAEFVPGNTTAWTASSDTLSPGNPVTLSWRNQDNVTFQMLVSVDDKFMFTVEQSVQNDSGEAIEIAPYGMISRKGEPKTAGLYILHEGPIGVFDGDLQEIDYGDLEDDGDFQSSALGGWMGFTDKFWMTTLIPDPAADLSLSRIIRRTNNGVNYRVDFVQQWQPVPTGTVQTTTNRLYSGAKIVEAIDNYGETLGIQKFDLAIDWGWFWFLTKLIFAAIHYLFQVTGNFGVAILLMTVILKLFLFPLANKSYVSMSHMKRAQPKIKALQERYGDDKAKMQQEMMALYKKEKINPMAGCLPLIPQMFIFFALYKVLYVTIEMRHQPFVLWIKDLSAADPVTPLNLFGLIPWDPPSVIAIGVLPILMGVSMWLMQKLNPQASMDPMQQKIMNMLPIIFTFVMAQFSAGLVLYWTWNNILSIGQQWLIMRREDARMSKASLKAQEK